MWNMIIARCSCIIFVLLCLMLNASWCQHRQEYSTENDLWNVYHARPSYLPTNTQDPDVIVVPQLGRIRGRIGYKAIKNRSINGFFGLKYGIVSQGIGRFQKARQPEYLSNEIIDATSESPNCPQFPDLTQILEAENSGRNVDDCLTLTIHAPNKTGLFPVMVFVHGEMLFDGGAVEGQPDYFMEHDMVLVSVNYRLAPFGYLTTLSDIMPGNVALADLQMALEWIQKFIRPFGGDPNQVTVFGQAAGATLVHALSLSGKATSLFHKIILQSGTALNPYFIDEEPLLTLRSFARLMPCAPNPTCFARLSTSSILKIFQRHWEENEPRGIRYTGGFKLVIGDKLGYLPQHPSRLTQNNVHPLILGVTKDAGAFILSRFYKQLEQVRSHNISDFTNVVLKHTAQPRHHALWNQWSQDQIFDIEDARNPTLLKLLPGLLELTNFILYRAPIIDSIRFIYKTHRCFLYSFDYRGEYHRFSPIINHFPFAIDALLSDENIYLFPYPDEVSRLNTKDMTVSRALTTMWYNFASQSVPNSYVGSWPNMSSEYGPFVRVTNLGQNILEWDNRFDDGMSVPILYPESFNKSTTKPFSPLYTTKQPYRSNVDYQRTVQT